MFELECPQARESSTARLRSRLVRRLAPRGILAANTVRRRPIAVHIAARNAADLIDTTVAHAGDCKTSASGVMHTGMTRQGT